MRFVILALGPPLPGTGRRLRAWNVSGWSSWLAAGRQFDHLAGMEPFLAKAKADAKKAGNLRNLAVVATCKSDFRALENAMRDLVYYSSL